MMKKVNEKGQKFNPRHLQILIIQPKLALQITSTTLQHFTQSRSKVSLSRKGEIKAKDHSAITEIMLQNSD